VNVYGDDDVVAKKVFKIFITFPAQFVTTTAEGEENFHTSVAD
jgi:hypothetical protein